MPPGATAREWVKILVDWAVQGRRRLQGTGWTTDASGDAALDTQWASSWLADEWAETLPPLVDELGNSFVDKHARPVKLIGKFIAYLGNRRNKLKPLKRVSLPSAALD